MKINKIFLIVTVISGLTPLFAAKPVFLRASYQGHGYEVVPTPVTWYSAKKTAEKKDGYLVSITTPEENDFVIQLIKNATNGEGAEVWIGLTDNKLEGDWEWVSEEKITFQNWAQGEPNNFAYAGLGGSENCAHMWKDGKWNDYAGDVRIPFIIEYDHTIDSGSSNEKSGGRKPGLRSTR